MISTAAANRLANLPGVLPNIAPGAASIDLGPLLADPKTKTCGGEDGFTMALWRGPGLYGMHFVYAPGKAGKQALQNTRDLLEFLFSRCGALLVYGAAPRSHRASRAMARALGATPLGSTYDLAGRECIAYTMDRSQWATLSASLAAQTRRFQASTT